MGRELRRVPIDFSWPLKETWKGYLRPEYRKCSECEGGQPYSVWWLNSILSLVSVLGEEVGRTGKDMHPYLSSLMNAPGHYIDPNGTHRPGDGPSLPSGRVFRVDPVTDDRISSLMNGLTKARGDRSEWYPNISSDGYMLMRVLLEAAGMDEDSFYKCSACDGTGVDPRDQEIVDAWDAMPSEDKDPPTGDGYQLWETTSEGSPISPAFESLDELCDYAAEHCSVFGSDMITSSEWKSMLDDGFVTHEVTMSDGSKAIFI
jgi:hypothetical protein